jgi:hypothetical protein
MLFLFKENKKKNRSREGERNVLDREKSRGKARESKI